MTADSPASQDKLLKKYTETIKPFFMYANSLNE